MTDQQTRWQLYRHRNNPEIEFYASVEEEVVKIKCPRNARFPQYDYPTVEAMPPGPDMPAEEFLGLYERVR